MSPATAGAIHNVIVNQGPELLADWLAAQRSAGSLRPELIREAELLDQSRRFLGAISAVLSRGSPNGFGGPEWDEAKEFLASMSQSRADQGFTPSETASFVLSLKEPLFRRLGAELADRPEALADEIWTATRLLDQLGLYTTEANMKRREEVIRRQQEELIELSTPVVELWDDIVALPLIGTLDSARTQVVMENLLTKITETGAAIAIIDITGVPTVDTLVAQHLLKTVAAARLMGADCIISGIRPSIAQTIVHLGVNLSDVTTKASLADALALAFERSGYSVARRPTDG